MNGSDQLTANFKATEVTLLDEEMKSLGNTAPILMGYVGWMLAQSVPAARLLTTGTALARFFRWV